MRKQFPLASQNRKKTALEGALLSKTAGSLPADNVGVDLSGARSLILNRLHLLRLSFCTARRAVW